MAIKVTAVGMEEETDLADPSGNQRRLRRANHANGYVRFAAQEVFRTIGEGKLYDDILILGAKVGQDRRQNLGAYELGSRDPHGASRFAGPAGCGTHQRIGSRRHRLRMGLEIEGGIGRRKPVWRAREKSDTQQLFHLVDMPAERWLSEPQRPRSTR